VEQLYANKSFFVESAGDITTAAELLLSGNVLLVKCGGAYAFFLNPNIEGLAGKMDRLKNRESGQYFSLACSHSYMLRIADYERINQDFCEVTKRLQGRAMFRFPLNTKGDATFPYNRGERSIQCYNFLPVQAHNNVFRMELERLGCPFTLVTSGNLHGDPSCTSFDDACDLAAAFNDRACDLGMPDVRFIAVYFPPAHGEFKYKGSFPILSFLNSGAIEVARLINNDMEFTQDFLGWELKTLSIKTSIEYKTGREQV
jgi:hypothetical protein